MSKAYSKIYNEKSKHISLRHEYVRQLLEDGVISIVYVKSSSNLADLFTKGLSRDLVKVTSIGMRLKPFWKESPTVGTQLWVDSFDKGLKGNNKLLIRD